MPKAKWQQYTDDELKNIVKESRSFCQLLEKLGYNKTSGSARASIKKMLENKQIDYSHFLGQGWNVKTVEDVISSPLTLKNKLLAERGHKCEKCGNSFWLNVPIPLELHHKNGNHYDNSYENLGLLCPNCHALTENYKGKNHKNIKISDEKFLEALKTSPNIHQACLKVGITPCQSSYARAKKLISKNL